MDTLHCLCLLVSVLVIICKVVLQGRHRNNNLPPSPPGITVLGHLQLLKPPVHLSLHNLCNKYGPVLFLRLGSRATLAISTASAAEECFTKNDIIFSNRPRFPSKQSLEYNYTGIGMAPYGPHWRNLRRLLTLEIFSSTCVQMSSSVRTEEIRFLTKQLFNYVSVGVQKIEVKSLFYILTFNIIMKMLAGNRCFEDDDVISDKGKCKLDDLMQLYSPVQSVALVDYFPILRWLPTHGMEKKIKELHNKRDRHAQDLLDAYRIARLSSSATEGERKTIIDALLSLQLSEPEFCTDIVIKGIIRAMLVGGTETSTTTLAYAASQLLMHPEIFNKASEEIDANIKESRLLDDADFVKLPYLRCIINEALRLGNAALIIARESSEECKVGGYNIPSGTMLMVNAWSLHRDPYYWEDPNEFKPERFLGTESEKQGFRFMAFGGGRRQCPGAGLATRVMMLTLGTLIQCFEWEKAEDFNGSVRTDPDTVEVVLRPRKSLINALSQL